MRQTAISQRSRKFSLFFLLMFIFLCFPLLTQPTAHALPANAAGASGSTSSLIKKKADCGTWIIKSSGTYFRDKRNRPVKKAWKTINKKTYYFNSDGKMRTGWFTYKKQRYYLHKDGHMQKGWLTLNGKKYYFTKKGTMVRGWLQLSKKNYYFHKNTGVMKTGWATISGKRYYFSRKGVMVKGWLTTKDGKRYYFNSRGIMQTGQCFIKNKGYVFRADGSLDKTAVYQGINPGKKMVALTFDDGPGRYTQTLLNTLEKYNAKATFFLVGESVPRYPSTIRKMYQIGCEIGNHTYSHARLTSLSSSQIQSQISRTNAKIRAITGHNPTVMRPPYGSYNSSVLRSVGLPAVYWSIDPRDWDTLSTYSTVNHIKQNVRDGSIILIHDIYSSSVQAAIQLIPWLQKQGYQLVTVSEMGKYRKGGLKAGNIYHSMYK